MATESLFSLLARGLDVEASRQSPRVLQPPPTITLHQVTPEERRQHLRHVLVEAMKITSDMFSENIRDLEDSKQGDDASGASPQ